MMAVLIAKNLKIIKEQWSVHCETEMKSVWLDTVTIKIIMTQYAWIINGKIEKVQFHRNPVKRFRSEFENEFIWTKMYTVFLFCFGILDDYYVGHGT